MGNSYTSPVFAISGVLRKQATIVELEYVYNYVLAGKDATTRKVEFGCHGAIFRDLLGRKISGEGLKKGDRVLVAYADSGGSRPNALRVYQLPDRIAGADDVAGDASSLDETRRVQVKGVSLAPAGGWEVESSSASPGTGKPAMTLRGPRLTSLRKPSLFVFVQETEITDLNTLSEILQAIVLEDKEGHMEVTSDARVGDTPAGKIRFVTEVGGFPFRQELTFFLRDGKAVMVLYGATPDDFDGFLEHVRAMVGALRLE